MDLSNINLFPKPDPLIPPISPPAVNPEVMGAIDNASLGMNPIGPIQPVASATEPDLSNIDIPDLTKFPDEAKRPLGDIDVSYLTKDNYQDAADYQIAGLQSHQNQLQERQAVGSGLFDSPLDAGASSFSSASVPTESVEEHIAPALKPSAGGGSPVNNMRPGPPPRPITGISGYGESGKVPPAPKPGSIHSASMEREDTFDTRNDALQTKGHASVENAFNRDVEQGRQHNQRIQNQKAQREFDTVMQGKKAKTPGSNLPKEKKPCPRCEGANIDLEWKMCMPCMQRLLVKIEREVGIAK